MTISTSPIPDFTTIPLGPLAAVASDTTWSDLVRSRFGDSPEKLSWLTPEQIRVKREYHAADLKGVEHLSSLPGLPPYVRGPYPTMYVLKPWTVRQYAGFSTAEASNAFYRRNLAAGQKASRSPSISRPIAGMTATTRASPVMSAWPASPSIRCSTWTICSKAFRSARSASP